MRKEKDNILIIIMIYFVVNLFFLDNFPFMHSDESWLSGLTRTMMNEGLNFTETFFNLLPRYPHAIKTIFHIIQMPFILVFGYNLFAVRLVSLIFGCIALYLFYKVIYKVSDNKMLSIFSVAILAFDVQFIYASHFARQEIIIVFSILLAYFYVLKNIESWSYKKDIVTAIIVGLMVGIHPNSFIVALIVGSIYLYYVFFEKKISFKNLLVLICGVSAFALVFVGISYIFDSQFITHYLKYGDHLGVTQTFWEKVKTIVPFYQKLWFGISGTYYTPFIKMQLVVFALSIISSVIYSFYNKKVLLFLFPILAVNVGYIVIGRYSQPSILFMFFTCWLLTIYLISKIRKLKIVLAGVLATAMLTISIVQIVPYLNSDYNDYLENISNSVPKDSKVLANLNTEYAFSYNSLYDYRNLGYLDDNSLSFEDYVKTNGIEYIIYPEEMDYIYETRPVWNIVYGNIYPYYEDMQNYLDSKCELIDEFNSPYAMRITKYSSQKDWFVKIYKVAE